MASHSHLPWQTQLQQAIRTPKELLQALSLQLELSEAEQQARRQFPLLVPRSFVERMEPGTPDDPLFQQIWASPQELIEVEGFSCDPLEEHQTEVPGLIHKYKSRVLLIVRGGCAVNCRYCFRRHFPYQENKPTEHHWQDALSYIVQHSEINEVILSGGDPLMASDPQLAKLVSKLEAIAHLKRLRIHSRLPVVIPQRLTPELGQRLAESRLQVTLVLHINHANEIDTDLIERLASYRKYGIWLLNQSVLLAGVNDSVSALCELSEKLASAGIHPYYLHLLDKVAGAAHFDVAAPKALELVQGMMRELPGFLVPKLVREIAGKCSKTPVDLRSE